jgi:hypothetical protein
VTNENTTLALLNQEQQLHLVNGLATIDEKFKKKAANSTYVEAFRYLEDLVEGHENDELAQLLLSNEDFVLYKEDKEKKIAKYKEITKIQIKDTTYLGYISLVLGALKELVWDNPSHTPFLDIIHEIRNKINLYIRFMRDQYNVVNDKVVDSISELALFQEKINVANIRLNNILLSFITLSIQITCYAIQYLYNKNRLEELENAKSDSNEKLANNNGPILAIKDKKSDSNKTEPTVVNEVDELIADFENLNLKNK